MGRRLNQTGPMLHHVKRLRDIGQHILNIFQSNGQAYPSVTDTVGGALLPSVGGMGHAGRVLRQCLGIAQTNRTGHQLQSIHELNPCLQPALQFKCHHAAKLAQQVSLLPSPCWRRVRQLEESGVIEVYHARLSRHKLGYGVTGFVHLQMSNHLPEVMAAFEREVVALPDALVCHNLSGHYDYLIEAIAVDLESFS